MKQLCFIPYIGLYNDSKLTMLSYNGHVLSFILQDYKVSVMLRQKWSDPRLEFAHISNRSFLSLPGHSSDLLWVPDLIFVNEKDANVHEVTVPNKLLRIYANGTILYSQRQVYKYEWKSKVF